MRLNDTNSEFELISFAALAGLQVEDKLQAVQTITYGYSGIK